jgi:hypothetical protein
MPRVMARVALEIAHCLAQAPATPAPASTCGAATFSGRIDPAGLASASCNARGAQPAWWPAWSDHVLFAAGAPAGLTVFDSQGRALGGPRRLAVVATQAAGECLEGHIACGPSGCSRVTTRSRTRALHDALASIP